MDTCFSLDTKKSIHFQIIAAVSLFTDEVLPFSGGVSLINDDDLEMDADKNKFSSRNDDVSIVKRE